MIRFGRRLRLEEMPKLPLRAILSYFRALIRDQTRGRSRHVWDIRSLDRETSFISLARRPVDFLEDQLANP